MPFLREQESILEQRIQDTEPNTIVRSTVVPQPEDIAEEEWFEGQPEPEPEKFVPVFPQGFHAPEEEPDPNKPGVLKAAAETENLMWNLHAWANRPNVVIEDYNVYRDDDLKGYEDFFEEFMSSTSPEETQWIKKQIDRGLQNRKVLEDAGWAGFGAQVLMGVADPTLLVPFAGWGYKAGKTGTLAARAAGTALTIEAGREAVLHQAQPVRSIEESIANIGGSVVIAGALGFGIGKLHKARADTIEADARMQQERQRLEEEYLPPGAQVGQVPEGGVLELPPGAAQGEIPPGAEQTFVRSYPGSMLDLKDVQRMADDFDTVMDVERHPDPRVWDERLNEDPEMKQIVGEKSIRYAGLGNISPEFRGRTSQSSVVRNVIERIVDTSLYTTANDVWQATKQSLETTIRLHERYLVRAQTELIEQWKNYNARYKSNPSQQEIRTFQQFKEEAGKASRRGGEHHVIEVRNVAEAYRTNIFDRIWNYGKRTGAIEDEVLELTEEGIEQADTNIKTYFTRSYNRLKIRSERGTFTDLVERHFVARANAKAAKEGKTLTDEQLRGLRESAEDAVQSILGESMDRTGRIKKGRASPFRERILDVPDEVLEPYLISDIEIIGNDYHKFMIPNIEFMREFGDLDLENVVKRIGEEYAELAKGADPKAQRKLNKAKEEDIELIKRLRDRVLGRVSRQAMGIDRYGLTARVLKALRQLQYMSKLGGVWFTSWADVARPIMVHGFGRSLKTIGKYVSSKDFRRMTKIEMEKMSIGLDHALQSRLLKYAELYEDIQGDTVAERLLQKGERMFSKLTIMNYHNDFFKKASGMMTADRIIDVAMRAKAGKLIRGNDKRLLALLGIDEAMAKRIANQMDELTSAGRTTKDGKLWLTNLDHWTDAEAKGALMAAVNKHVDMIINTPTAGNQPLFLDNAWAKVLMQFRSFLFASHTQTLLSGLQARDTHFYTGAMTAVMAGYGISMLKEAQAGRDPEQVSVADAIDRSGVLSVMWELNNIADKWSGGRVSFNAAVGGTGAKRFASRNKLQALFGPTYGMAEDALMWTELLSVPGGPEGRDVSASDIARLRRILPYQNLFWLRGIFDEIENGAQKAFDVNKRRERPGLEYYYPGMLGIPNVIKEIGEITNE